MPSVIPSSPAPGGAAADIFLHLQTKRAGKAKGEATSPGHEDDIVVLGWQWAVAASSAIGSAQATGRRSYTAMTVRKSIDRATTALLAALATNDEVKEARLTMRRAGGSQEDFFKITLKGARIAQVEHLANADGTTHETIGIVFTKVDVEYTPQLATGLRSGSTSFSDEIAPDAG